MNLFAFFLDNCFLISVIILYHIFCFLLNIIFFKPRIIKLPLLNFLLAHIRPISSHRLIVVLLLIASILFYLFVLFLSLNIIIPIYSMVIEQFANWYHWCKLELFAEWSACYVDMNPLIVLFGPLWALQYLIFLLELTEQSPLVLKNLSLFVCYFLYCRIIELLNIF